MLSGSTGTDRGSTKLSRFVSVLLCFWCLEAVKAHEKDIRPDMISLDRLWLGSMDIKQRLSGAKIHCPQTVEVFRLHDPSFTSDDCINPN